MASNTEFVRTDAFAPNVAIGSSSAGARNLFGEKPAFPEVLSLSGIREGV